MVCQIYLKKKIRVMVGDENKMHFGHIPLLVLVQCIVYSLLIVFLLMNLTAHQIQFLVTAVYILIVIHSLEQIFSEYPPSPGPFLCTWDKKTN